MSPSSRPGARRGAAAVEFALTFPLFLTVLAGVIDGGMYLSDSFAVSRAARDGARVGSMTMEPPPANGNLIEAAAIDAAETSMNSSSFASGYTVTADWIADGANIRWLQVTVVAERTPIFGELSVFPSELARSFTVLTQEQPD